MIRTTIRSITMESQKSNRNSVSETISRRIDGLFFDRPTFGAKGIGVSAMDFSIG